MNETAHRKARSRSVSDIETRAKVNSSLKRRHLRTRILYSAAISAVVLSLMSLAAMVMAIASSGVDALTQYRLEVNVGKGDIRDIAQATDRRKRLVKCRSVLRSGAYDLLGESLNRADRKAVRGLLSFAEDCSDFSAVDEGEVASTILNSGAADTASVNVRLSASAGVFIGSGEWSSKVFSGEGEFEFVRKQESDDSRADIWLVQVPSEVVSMAKSLQGYDEETGQEFDVVTVTDAGGFEVVGYESANTLVLKRLYGSIPDQTSAVRNWKFFGIYLPQIQRDLDNRSVAMLLQMHDQDRISSTIATEFFFASASRYPEASGIYGALIGTAMTLFVTFWLAFPVGVGAGIFLEEFAPRRRWISILEISINNLAAVPSIVFGLLGLALIINTFQVPRSTPLVGGVVLALMVMPNIVVATRAALLAVPKGIRNAAMALGASEMQMVFHHVVPAAVPGIMTGSIISMARALGETAPLLMVGMVAFITSAPTSLVEPATVLPVQVYLWAASPETTFAARSSAAIIMLLLFLIVMNLTAVVVRNRFQTKW